MNIIETNIKDVIVYEPNVFTDGRGYFIESYSHATFPASIIAHSWVQDNESKSTRGVLRGLHYQCGEHAQAKLVRAISGEVYDVVVDIRPDSDIYGQWHAEILSGDNKRQMYIPRGFAHGFLVLSDTAVFAYKCDQYYNRDSEGGILFSDTTLDIPWPMDKLEIIVSDKDRILPSLGQHRHI